MNYCGGIDSGMNILGLRIEYTTARSTVKYQLLDQNKILLLLLWEHFDVMLHRASRDIVFSDSIESWNTRLKDGFLPNIEDAFNIFDESW